MESHVLPMLLTIVVLFHVAYGSSLGIFGISPSGTENSTGHGVVKPEYVAEPDDKFVLPNSPAALLCEAKFVTKLKFNCSKGLVPKEIYNSEDENNATLVIAEISQALFKSTRGSDVVCICVAIGYNGQVLRSRAATVEKAYLDEVFVISPSIDTRVPKNSLVTLRCESPTGIPSPAVSWWKDGDPVDTHKSRRVQAKNRANLTLVIIRKAKFSDEGSYSCVASNLVGRHESAIIKLNVYVDGGWSDWREFQPCTAAKCGNGTRMLKRFCSNPTPENGGQFCAGSSIKIEPCQDICPDVEITCPNDTKVYINRSDVHVAFKNISWNKPLVHNNKNGTKFSVEVFPRWAEPPVMLNATNAVYVIKYVVTHEFGQTASCLFNLSVYDDSSSACLTKECRNGESTKSPGSSFDSGTSSEFLVKIGLSGAAALILVVAVLVAVFLLRYRNHHRKSRNQELIKFSSGAKDTLDHASHFVCRSSSYIEPATPSGKLKAASPTDSEVFLFPAMSDVPAPYKELKVELNDEQKREKGRDYKRTNSSVSNKSTASELSRMMWNMVNIPENADPKMVAWGLVDHNGGKFTIGNTGVSLTIPRLAIPEGRTEGIYVAIVDQEKEHPQITSKESLLSPVVKCGPTGLKFQRPVILSMPHCALLDKGAWNLKVQYNESEPSTTADWKQLIDVSKQDGTEASHVVVEPNMVHLMVDHFTSFVVIGESASNQHAERTLLILAYVTPPEADRDCVVRVYCVGGTPAAVEDVHNYETTKYRGETIDPPKQLHFKDGGGDLLVKLTDHQPGWTTGLTTKKILFRDIWEGIERMPSCTFVFSLSDTSVSRFRATFEVKQNCQDGGEQEVNVVTSVKQGPIVNPDPRNNVVKQPNTNLTYACKASTSFPQTVSSPNLVDQSTALLYAGSGQMSSGYISIGFESLPTVHSLSRELRSKLSVILDPPHEADWKVLAENIGLSNKDIRWIDTRKALSPTDTLFNYWEMVYGMKCQYPLQKLADIFQKMGRDDAAKLVEAELLPQRETSV